VTKITIVEDDVEVEDDIEIDVDADDDSEMEEYIPQEIEEEEIVEAEIFTVVEAMPEFPGGMGKLMAYLGNNIKYPPLARESGIQGRVFINFVVEPDGKISNVKVLRGIGGGCDEEAIRVVEAMPKWKPGMQRGKPVRVSYNLPVKFTLQ
jgi:protein TonB